MQKLSLTNDQKLLFNFLISLLCSSLIAALLAMYQYYTAKSTINAGSIIIAGISVFGVSFGHGLYAYVPGHLSEEMQALKDTMTELQKNVATMPVTPSNVSSSPLVVIHTAQAPTPSVATVEVPPVSGTVQTESMSVAKSTTTVVSTPEDDTQKVTAVLPAVKPVVKPERKAMPSG